MQPNEAVQKREVQDAEQSLEIRSKVTLGEILLATSELLIAFCRLEDVRARHCTRLLVEASWWGKLCLAGLQGTSLCRAHICDL